MLRLHEPPFFSHIVVRWRCWLRDRRQRRGPRDGPAASLARDRRRPRDGPAAPLARDRHRPRDRPVALLTACPRPQRGPGRPQVAYRRQPHEGSFGCERRTGWLVHSRVTQGKGPTGRWRQIGRRAFTWTANIARDTPDPKERPPLARSPGPRTPAATYVSCPRNGCTEARYEQPAPLFPLFAAGGIESDQPSGVVLYVLTSPRKKGASCALISPAYCPSHRARRRGPRRSPSRGLAPRARRPARPPSG